MSTKASSNGSEMNVTERHIEMFDRYINGDLNATWKKAFEEKLDREPKFKEAFEEHLLVVTSLKKEGRKLLKSDLAAATVGAVGAAALVKYRPRSGRIMRWIMKALITGGIVAGGIYYYINEIQPTLITEPETEVEEVKEMPAKKIPPKKTSPKKSVKVERETIVDTVYVYEYDTVYVDPGSEEAKNIGTVLETETIFEYSVDTIHLEAE